MTPKKAADQNVRIKAVAAAATGVLLATNETVLQEVLRQAANEVMHFDVITLGIYDPATESLHYVGTVDDGRIEPSSVVFLAGTPAQRVLQQRRSLLTLRADAADAAGGILVGTMRRSESIIRTPILAGEEVLGLLSVQSYTPDLYSAGDVEVLEVLASLAAFSLRNIRQTAEQHKTEEALRQNEQLLRSTFDHASVGLALVALDGKPISVNPALEQFLGYPREQLLSMSFPEFTHPDDIMVDWTLFQDMVANRRQFYQIEKRYLRSDGAIVWGRLSASLVRDADGQPLYATGVLEDITERRATQDALAASEERFRTVTERMSDIVSIFDAAGKGIYHSPAYDRLLGVDSASRVGRSVFEQVHPDDHGIVRAALIEVRDAPDRSVAFRSRLRHADGTWITMETSVTNLLSNPSINGLVAVSRDVTAQAAAAHALRESEERFRQMAEAVPEVFWLADSATAEILYVSPAYEQVFGYPLEELYSDGLSWLSHVHPSDLAAVLGALGTVRTGEFGEVFRTIKPNGDVRWISAKLFVIRNELGEPYRTAGVVEDITARREMEYLLQSAQKMEVVGQLAAGIAHEFNSLITGIHARAEFQLHGLTETDPRWSDANEIRLGAVRASGLTRRLVGLGQREIVQPRTLDLHAVVDEAMPALQGLLSKQITLTHGARDGAGSIRADRNQIEQILINLVMNSRDAMGNTGAITIQTRSVGLTETEAQLALPPGRYVELSVSDSGSGMDEATQRRVFEPFFSTRSSDATVGVGLGLGLGLATVRAIVTQYGGSISVESSPGQGTRMILLFPAVQEEATPLPKPLQMPRTPPETQTILIVEDQDDVRSVIRRVLEKRKFKVLSAASASEALTLYAADDSIDLLITDVVMPGMSGLQLAHHLHALNPGLPIIFISGYTEDDILRQGLLPDNSWFLEKPFSTKALADTVDEALHDSALALAVASPAAL